MKNGKNSRKNNDPNEYGSSNVSWNNHVNRKPAKDMENKSYKDRRAEHYDSCLWGEPKVSSDKMTKIRKSKAQTGSYYAEISLKRERLDKSVELNSNE